MKNTIGIALMVDSENVKVAKEIIKTSIKTVSNKGIPCVSYTINMEDYFSKEGLINYLNKQSDKYIDASDVKSFIEETIKHLNIME